MTRETYRTHLHTNLRELSLEVCRKAISDWGKQALELARPLRPCIPRLVSVRNMNWRGQVARLARSLTLSGRP